MPGLVPGIHVFLSISKKDVDGRVKPGHDENDSFFKQLERPAKWACFFGQALRSLRSKRLEGCRPGDVSASWFETRRKCDAPHHEGHRTHRGMRGCVCVDDEIEF
jgi:hypothetical protein